MAVPNELFRVWVQMRAVAFGTAEVYFEWANVWYVLATDPLANPADVALPFAGHYNLAINTGLVTEAAVVYSYGGRNVNAGGPDVEVFTGNSPIGGALDILPPQCAVLVLGQSLRKRSQTRKWVGGGRLGWVDGSNGRVLQTNGALVGWWRDFLTQKLNAGMVIQPVVFDEADGEVREIQDIHIMEGFRTIRRRSLNVTGQFA